mmetsp:Transcript_106457/g.339061  ORF Transcript_106457/g.339061 Transcript_106457/m.339061 type:complete len:262 (-) Transcript_106457:170-955(-)
MPKTRSGCWSRAMCTPMCECAHTPPSARRPSICEEALGPRVRVWVERFVQALRVLVSLGLGLLEEVIEDGVAVENKLLETDLPVHVLVVLPHVLNNHPLVVVAVGVGEPSLPHDLPHLILVEVARLVFVHHLEDSASAIFQLIHVLHADVAVLALPADTGGLLGQHGAVDLQKQPVVDLGNVVAHPSPDEVIKGARFHAPLLLHEHILQLRPIDRATVVIVVDLEDLLGVVLLPAREPRRVDHLVGVAGALDPGGCPRRAP